MDAGRRPAVRVRSVFLAVCVKCVSLDTDSIPPEINPPGPPSPPPPPSTVSPPTMLTQVCVCWCVCVCLGVRVYVGRGSACPVPRHLQGATGKRQLCVWEKAENVEEERVEGQQACQSRPSLLEWVPPSLLPLLHLLSSAVTLSCLLVLSRSTCLLLLPLSLSFFSVAVFCSVCKNPRLHLPNVFILSHQTVKVLNPRLSSGLFFILNVDVFVFILCSFHWSCFFFLFIFITLLFPQSLSAC